MRISRCASASSSLVRPVRSAPNNTAAGPRALISWMRTAASCRSSARKLWSRGREVVAATNPTSATASATLSTTRALASRSSAPDARAVASGCGYALGRTSTSSARAMFFMARATAPMFPGCEGSTSTMRMASSGTACIIAALFGRPTPPMQPLLNLAVKAARRAGDIIVRAMPRLDSIEIHSKGRNDYVTYVDRAAEADIIETVRRLYPDHAFLAEESGQSGSGDVVWIIDPLDGTTNFMHGFPTFAVSIACQIRGRMEHAVVFDVMRQELFTASRGEGAQLDGRKIRVSKQATLEGSLIATGFPYRADSPWLDEYLAMLKSVMVKAAGLRRPGAAAIDLAYVAAGRVDGFWEMGLKPWDTAAGTLLITEAGGRVGTLTGDDYKLGPHIVGGAPKLYAALLATLAPHVTGELKQ